MLLVAGSGSAFASRWKPTAASAWADGAQVPCRWSFKLDFGNRIICGDDPVNRHDPLGLDGLSDSQMARGQQALRDVFEYQNGQPRLLDRFATRDEFQREARRVFENAAVVFPEVRGQLTDALAAVDSYVDKLAPAWAAQRCASEAQTAAEACAMNARNAAYNQYTGSFTNLVGYGARLGVADVASAFTNVAGFDVTMGLEYDGKKFGPSWGTEEISGWQQAMAIGMFFIPESKAALPELRISASKYPKLAENIFHAQKAGHPSVLTHGGEAVSAANRRAALHQPYRDFVPNVGGGLTRDEYPFASAREGGAGAWVGHIPASQNSGGGQLLSNFIQANKITPGSKYRVVIVP